MFGLNKYCTLNRFSYNDNNIFHGVKPVRKIDPNDHHTITILTHN